VTDRARWAERSLAYHFNDPALLEQALTHRSASRSNYERLEFLGDALLNFAVAKELYRIRPDATEGDLSRARASLVKKPTLAEIGRELGIDNQIILGRGELRAGGAQRTAALADTVEALIGAIYLDGGLAAAETLIAMLLADRYRTLPAAAELKDAKTKLQEWLQARGLPLPTYEVEAVHGREHDKSFVVVCSVDYEHARTTGSGSSRRHAEQQAAAAMLSVLAGEQE
jgi:ribonuclease III